MDAEVTLFSKPEELIAWADTFDILLNPVSYTHLDVYKRQAIMRDSETISAVPTMQRFQVLHHAEPVKHQLMSCLLYTSRCV